MTVNQKKRAGRLQEKGYLEYGKDGSRFTARSMHERPMVSQKISRNNKRDCISMHRTLVQLERICWRKNVGRKNYKGEGSEIFPIDICNISKNNCFLDYILGTTEEELQVQQGSLRNL